MNQVLSNWPLEKPAWTKENTQLMLIDSFSSTSFDSVVLPVTLDQVISRSEEFPIEFPIDVVRCKTLKDSVSSNILEKYINSAYPIIHENALLLYTDFLEHKRQHGHHIEKDLYKDMTLLDFVDRLLTKRAVMFMGRFDSYILLDGTRGSGKWNFIGTPAQTTLTIDNCLSYDEIKLSVFLSVSSYTYFINEGGRRNLGTVVENRSKVQNEGIIIGLIGARLKKANVMEYQEMVISKSQNAPSHGYGDSSIQTVPRVLLNFYEEPCLSYEDLQKKLQNEAERFLDVGEGAYLDAIVYSKRIALSIDTLLIEANHRAKERNTSAYIHVVGIGLGVWKCSPLQEQIFADTFANRLKTLGKNLGCVSDVYFSYFNKIKSVGGYTHGQTFPISGHLLKGIKMHIGKRDPHTKLTDQDAGKLLVVSYAWDGNSLPGNEFWDGKLGSTGDSAAAASTQITEIHNPHINDRVCCNNLHIATSSGVISFKEYANSIANNIKCN